MPSGTPRSGARARQFRNLFSLAHPPSLFHARASGTASASALNDGLLRFQVPPPLWSGRAHCPVRGYHPGRGVRRFTIYVWIYLNVGPAIGISCFMFPIVSPASHSLLALFPTLRRHGYRLLRQRLVFSTPSRVVVASGFVVQHCSPKSGHDSSSGSTFSCRSHLTSVVLRSWLHCECLLPSMALLRRASQ